MTRNPSTKVAIVSYARTPIGSFMGKFAEIPAPRLAAHAIQSAIQRAGIDPGLIESAYIGNVLQAGEGQAPARQAIRYAGIPDRCRTVTVNKVCGSGMQAIISGAREILLGEAEVVLAGGMESMSQAPYLLPQARKGYRMGNTTLVDSMIYDGLWDPYHNMHMGNCGELCARRYGFGREAQDAFALESVRRAQEATKRGAFKDEIAPFPLPQGKETILVDVDEGVERAKPEKIPTLKPAFDSSGTITAANASSINDGASAILLMSADRARALGIKPIAYIHSWEGSATDPQWFTIAPVSAMAKNWERGGIKKEDIDLFEINEAFAVVTMAAMKEHNLPHEKVNVRGGAVVLGHPIGMSGNRIVITLISALKEKGGHWGQAAICIGGGEALSMIIEMAD
jgi:acetyl-CoA C-acetyltransferase